MMSGKPGKMPGNWDDGWMLIDCPHLRKLSCNLFRDHTELAQKSTNMLGARHGLCVWMFLFFTHSFLAVAGWYAVGNLQP